MKKAIIFGIFLLSLGAFAANAQQNIYYQKSYVGNIESGAKVGGRKHNSVEAFTVNTIHGYSTGHGFFAGIGVGAEFYSTGVVSIPIFVDAKYSILNKAISPFIEGRAGVSPFAFIPDYEGDGRTIFICPAIGMDASRFSLRLAYEFDGNMESLDTNNYEDYTYSCHYVVLSLSYNF